MLAARLEAAEREQTIEDLRRRLDNKAEERRKLTARLVDHRENPVPAPPVDPAPMSFWRRLFGSRQGFLWKR